MEVNVDYYSGNRNKIIAIENFLGGQAANTASTFFEPSYPKYIKT